MRSSTSELEASRSHTSPVGDTSSKRVFATPAPNWTDRMPMSTSPIAVLLVGSRLSETDDIVGVTRSI